MSSLFSSITSRGATVFSLTPCQKISLESVRHASKKTGSSSTNGRKSAGKRLGLKEEAGTLVQTGNIIFRQRGYKFWPGEGVTAGRDHTIVATREGKVHIHYDLVNQRRYISVDDGTMPMELFPTRPVMKEQLANMVDAEFYLTLDKRSRYDYICEKINEIKLKQDESREKYLHTRVSEAKGHRKFSLVDLTLV